MDMLNVHMQRPTLTSKSSGKHRHITIFRRKRFHMKFTFTHLSNQRLHLRNAIRNRIEVHGLRAGEENGGTGGNIY